MSALDGIVVLDLGQIYAGPYCAHLLRAMGAQVIKIEPFGGEPIRWRSTGDTAGAAFLLLNAGKQGLRLDLKEAAGRELFLRLVGTADVVIENFAEGVTERLGISWEVLREHRPEVVLASIRAFGRHPAAEGLRGMDVTVQAMSGVVTTTGFTEGPPTKAGPAVVDFAAGSHLAAAILAALYERERTGAGQHVEVAMQDAIVPALASSIAGYLESDGDFPERVGNRHSGLSVVPYNIYPTRDGWIAVLCLRPRHWSALCRVMERADLADDPELSTPAGRVRAMDRVDGLVAAWTARATKAEVFALLQRADIPSAPVRSLEDVMTDPVLRERGMLAEVGEGDRASTAFGSPIRLGDAPVDPPGPAPLLGEDSAAVLREHLGLADDQIEELRQRDVI